MSDFRCVTRFVRLIQCLCDVFVVSVTPHLAVHVMSLVFVDKDG